MYLLIMATTFTCHAITEGPPSSGKTIAWCIVGQGRYYKGGWLHPLKDRVRMEYADAQFEESFPVAWSDVHLIKQGVDAYLRTKKSA